MAGLDMNAKLHGSIEREETAALAVIVEPAATSFDLNIQWLGTLN